MTEPSPPAQLPPVETVAYQPISGWAIAGLVVGMAFTLLVTVCAVVGLFQGAPVFFPLWILGLAILGMVLSLVGQQHVRNSEGTRAGAKLARAGLWLNLVSGLCYFSYYWFTGLALQNQANDFLMTAGEDAGFFPLLRESAAAQVKGASDATAAGNAAFLLTLPAPQRTGRAQDENAMRNDHDRPGKDGSPGQLTTFRDSIFPRLLYKQLAADAEITPGAVQEWEYKQRSYKIQRIYHIKTRELAMDFFVTVQSTEPEGGKSRKWFVNLRETFPIHASREVTPLGRGISLLRYRAKEFLDAWILELNQGNSFAAFKNKDQTTWHFALLPVPESQRDGLRQAIVHAFTGDSPNRLLGFTTSYRQEDFGKWEQVEGKLRLYLNFRFNLPSAEAKGPSGGTVHGYVVLDTRQPIDPAQFDVVSPAPTWDVARLVITQVVLPPPPERKG